RYIVSGHRRHLALTVLQRCMADCMVLDVNYRDLTGDERLVLLRAFNVQRDKTAAEQVREELLDVNPDLAYERLQAARTKSVYAAELNGVCLIDVEGAKKRYGYSESKAEHIDLIQRVLEERRPYWPLSVRGVHYALLNYDFIRGY